MSVWLKKQDFTERVNRWAIRHNAPTVNARMLEDWNEKAILPPAVAIQIEPGKVPEWHFGRQHYRRALIICRLKRGGIERYSAIRAALWLLRMERLPPIEDLIVEYERTAKQIVAGISSAFDPGISGFAGKKAETLMRQMGPLSPLLDVDGLRQSRELLLDGYQAGRFDRHHQDITPQMVVLAQGFLGNNVQFEDLNLPPLTNLFSGLMGSTDEAGNFASALLRTADPQSLNETRDFVWLYLNRIGRVLSWAKAQNLLAGERADLLIPPFLAVARAAKTDLRWRMVQLVIFLRLRKLTAGAGQAPSKMANIISVFNSLEDTLC